MAVPSAYPLRLLSMAGINTRSVSPGFNMMSPPERYGQGPPQTATPIGATMNNKARRLLIWLS
jgi:hypothetical protein